MPFIKFKTIDSKETLVGFFEKYFPDSIPLIGKTKLVEDFFAGAPSPLVAVKVKLILLQLETKLTFTCYHLKFL